MPIKLCIPSPPSKTGLVNNVLRAITIYGIVDMYSTTLRHRGLLGVHLSAWHSAQICVAGHTLSRQELQPALLPSGAPARDIRAWQVQASCRCLLIARFDNETQED